MRNKVAKAIRRECAKREMTPRGYRHVKDKYTRLQPILEEVLTIDPTPGEDKKFKRISVVTLKKRVLCPS